MHRTQVRKLAHFVYGIRCTIILISRDVCAECFGDRTTKNYIHKRCTDSPFRTIGHPPATAPDLPTILYYHNMRYVEVRRVSPASRPALSLCSTPPLSIHAHAAPPRVQPPFFVFIFENRVAYNITYI